MKNKIPFEIIYQCKMGNEVALKDILDHYEPLIVKASMRTVSLPNGFKQKIIDQDVKAYIESELAMKIMVNYDPTKEPNSKPQS